MFILFELIMTFKILRAGIQSAFLQNPSYLKECSRSLEPLTIGGVLPTSDDIWV